MTMENSSSWASEGPGSSSLSNTTSNQTLSYAMAGNSTEAPFDGIYPCQNLNVLSGAVVGLVTMAYATIFFFGVTGNALVGIVIWHNVDMRSSTNYFLVNLSLADLMVLLVCMPPPMLELYVPGAWLLGKFMCYLVTLLDSATAHASILTLLAIAVERYYVICMPFKANYTCTSKRTLIICCLVWIVAFLSSIPVVLMTVYDPCRDSASGDLVNQCGSYATSKWGEAYIGGIAFLFFLLPCAIMIIIYCIIANTLRKHDNYMAAIRKKESLVEPPVVSGSNPSTSRDGRLVELASIPRRNSGDYLMANNHGTATPPANHAPIDPSEDPMVVSTVENDANHYTALRSSAQQHQAASSNSSACQNLANAATRQSHRRVVFMLASVVAVFFVCWFPMRTVILWQVFGHTDSVRAWLAANFHTFMVMLAGFRILVYINSAINPILYNLISTKFRVAFRSVVRCENARRSRSKRSISTRSFTSTSSLRIHSRTTDYHG